MSPGNRQDRAAELPARRRPEREQQSLAAQLRSGPQDPPWGTQRLGAQSGTGPRGLRIPDLLAGSRGDRGEGLP